MQIPTIGRIVIFSLSVFAAEQINRRRADAQAKMEWHREHKTGAMVHIGNSVEAGQQFPAMIVAVWGKEPTSAVNLKVFLDGSDDFWATSVSVGEGEGTYAWPVRA